MTELVFIQNNRAATTSLILAEVFGKQHKDVLEAIDNKIDSAENSAQYENMFSEDTYKDKSGKSNRMYIMSRDGWTFIAFGFTGQKADKFKLIYINEFKKMEEIIKSQAIPLTAREQVQLALVANEETNVRVDQIEADLKNIKEKSLISTEDKNSLDRMIKKIIYNYCNDRRLGRTAKSMLFQDIGKSIKEMFNIPHRGRIKMRDFEAAIDFVNSWEPSTVTKTKIRQLDD